MTRWNIAWLALAVVARSFIASSCESDDSCAEAEAEMSRVEFLQVSFETGADGKKHSLSTANGLKDAEVAAVAAIAASKRGDSTHPDLVIVGVGDSGTRGVKDTMENLGMKFSPDQDKECGDNQPTVAADPFISRLLTSAQGRISPTGYRQSPELWTAATMTLKATLLETFAGIVRNSTDLPMDSDVVWGLKSPGQYYMLPVYDNITENITKYLFVARDPRDLCTEDVVNHHNATAKMMQWFGQYQEGTQNGTDCYGYWASSMRDMFELYENEPRFRIVRIEDLAMPDPTADDSSLQIYNSLADFVKLPRPSPEDALSWLSHMHSFNDSYEGYHYEMTDENRTIVEAEFAKHVQEHPADQVLLDKLGYPSNKYGLLTPSSNAVLQVSQ